MATRELEKGRVREALVDWVLSPVDLWSVFPTGRDAMQGSAVRRVRDRAVEPQIPRL